MTKALIFLDGNTCKIVFGNAIKCFPVSSYSNPEIDKFLDKIFSSYDVRVATSTSKTDKEAFVSAIERASSGTQVQSRISQSKPTSTHVPAPTQQQRKQAATFQAPDYSNINWVKSNAATTLVIDDLLTNEEVRPGTGIKKAFVISPDSPSSLAGIDQQSIRQSKILASLLRNGTLVPISQSEAFNLQNEYDVKIRQQQDDILDAASPIIDRKKPEEGEVMDTKGHNAPALDLTSEADLAPLEDPHANEGQGTMSELMAEIYQAENEEPQAEIVEITEGEAEPIQPEKVSSRPQIKRVKGS